MAAKVVLVTGGAQGLGRAFAEALLKRGTAVAIADMNQAVGRETEKDFKQSYPGAKSVFFHCDVTYEDQLRSVFERTRDQLGPLDLLINNAGLASEKNWQKMIDVNLKGMIAGTFLGLENMAKDKGGRGGLIVNLGSTASIIPIAFMPSYVASKFGIVGFSRSIASLSQVSGMGVRINCLCPSFADTQLVRGHDFLGDKDVVMGVLKEEGIMPVSRVVDALMTIVDDGSMNGAVVAVSKRGVNVKHDIAKSKM